MLVAGLAGCADKPKPAVDGPEPVTEKPKPEIEQPELGVDEHEAKITAQDGGQEEVIAEIKQLGGRVQIDKVAGSVLIVDFDGTNVTDAGQPLAEVSGRHD